MIGNYSAPPAAGNFIYIKDLNIDSNRKIVNIRPTHPI